MRLGRWQALAVALSIVWAVGAWLHEHNANLDAANSFASLTYKNCTNKKLLTHDSDLSTCESEREQAITTWLTEDTNSTADEAMAALAPIPFLWLGGFILLFVIRAQIAGFGAVIQWSSLNLWKKGMVAGCALASFALLIFSSVAILNLYVDTLVPVSLPPFVNVIPAGTDVVTAEGTWMRTDLRDDTILNPLQFSRIECRRREGQCIEASAYVTGSAPGAVLGADLNVFEIKSWTLNAIVFVDEGLCSTQVYTIDLNTKAVSGAGHLTNQETNFCKMGFKGKDTWTLLLSNGFNVYWELRRKARPLPLRLVQTFFER